MARGCSVPMDEALSDTEGFQPRRLERVLGAGLAVITQLGHTKVILRVSFEQDNRFFPRSLKISEETSKKLRNGKNSEVKTSLRLMVS